MIKIESIEIENFRGIKRFQHNLNSANLIVHGPNGSGKSGIIDAIEFALTGNICRLSGTGTSGITLNSHAPHVDCRDNPLKAKVIIHINNTLTNNSFAIERTVFSSQKPKITPDNEEGQNLLTFFTEHPEFSLSRREILKFIVTEPGKRAKEVQELLKMDSVEKLRSIFNKLNNETKRIFKEKSNVLVSTENELRRHFEIAEINKNNLLKKINERRLRVNLAVIDTFDINTKFSVDTSDASQKNAQLIKSSYVIE